MRGDCGVGCDDGHRAGRGEAPGKSLHARCNVLIIKYLQLPRQAPGLLNYGAKNAGFVTIITTNGEIKPRVQAQAGDSATGSRPPEKRSTICCRLVFSSFALRRVHQLHSEFCHVFAAIGVRKPLQEPFGDSRPQAFFIPGLAPAP